MALSLRQYSLSFGFITLVGISSSWLSSCAQSEAATAGSSSATTDQLLVVLNQSVQDIHTQVTNSAVDGTVAFKLNQIQADLSGQGAGPNSGANVLSTVSKLSDDIGLMSDRIGKMADRIVETEKLIVAVIAMQTDAATSVINNAKDDNGAPLLPNIPSPTPNVFDAILTGSNTGGTAPILSFGPGNIPTTTTPPDIQLSAATPRYELLVSDNARFASGFFNQVVNTNALSTDPDSLNSVWNNAIQSYTTNGVAPTQLFIAVKAIGGNNQLSNTSNSLLVTL